MANYFQQFLTYVWTVLKLILVLSILPASIFGLYCWFFNGSIQGLQGVYDFQLIFTTTQLHQFEYLDECKLYF